MFIIIVTCSSFSFTMIKIHIDKHFKTPTTCLSNGSETEHRVVPHKGTDDIPFTKYQLSKLKRRFRSGQYIKGREKELLAKDLGIPQNSLLSWFRYQRSLKRRLTNEASNATVVTA